MAKGGGMRLPARGSVSKSTGSKVTRGSGKPVVTSKTTTTTKAPKGKGR